MASPSSFHLNQRVSIAGKGLGTIVFVGKTEFADGEWIGIVLDEPKGKNNGTVQKKDGALVSYFSCNDNHGLYVRPGQIESVVSDSQTNLPRSASSHSVKSQASSTGSIPTSSSSGIPAKSSGLPSKQSGLRAPTSHTSIRPPGFDIDDDSTGLIRSTQSSNEIVTTTANERIPPPKEEVKPPPKEEVKPPAKEEVKPPPKEEFKPPPKEEFKPPPPGPISQPKPTISAPLPAPSTTQLNNTQQNSISDPSESQQLVNNLKSKITDQEEQIQTLVKKRRDDLEKLKEFERTKIQLDQLQSYKREAQERMKELNDKLQHQENELKDTRDKFAAYRDEMNDTEVRIESLALDLEMAEEKLETVTLENTTLKEKFEEVQLELDIIKGEIQLNGPNQVANGIQKKIDDERTVKMEQALIKLRDLSLTKQAENDTLKKQCETLEHKVKILTKENENTKTDITTMQTTIADLKEQVDTCLGAQQMVDILTTKNLSLEDQVRELQETVDNLESLCDMDKEMEEHAKELEHDLRQNIDLLQNQLREKERRLEQLQYTIGDHEKTILKFRETVKTMQLQNEQTKKQIEKYDEQLKFVGSVQSSEFKAKIVETKSYGEIIEGELKKIDVHNLSRHVQLLTLFLPEQFIKRGADHDCILVFLLIQRLISKCNLLTNEIEKKVERIHQLNFDDVIKSHRAEQWSFTCKLCLSLSICRMILRKYLKAMETCNPDTLRLLASTYHDLLSYEKPLDFLIDLLQKDQIHDSISLNALDKTITFYEHIYKSYLSQEKFSMSNYMRDLARIVLLSSDALQTDTQRIQILQKEHGQPGNDQSPFADLVKRLVNSNEQMRAQAAKINRLVPQEDDINRSLTLDTDTISSIELTIRHLDRLAKTFHEICSDLTTQILLLGDVNERVSTQDIESIAYQACDKIYKKEDSGPYDSLWESMHETISTLTTIGNSIEHGLFDSNSNEQNEKPKQAIYLIAEQLKTSMNEADLIRSRLELKDEELIDLKKMFKLKHDELSELNIRLSLNEKRVESLQKESDEKANKLKQVLEEARIDAEKKIKQCEDAIAVLQNDNEQLEQEKSALNERLKQLTKTKLVDTLTQKKIGTTQRTSSPTTDGGISPQRQLSSSSYINEGTIGSTVNEQEIVPLRNTIRLLKDEIWQLKMTRTSNELSKLQIPLKDKKTNEIADIYKSSTLLLNDLFTTIANYKITGENVAVKQELIRSKMKLVDQTAFNLNNRLNQCQSNILPGSIIQTKMKTFSNPQFAKSLKQDRQLAAEIHLPGVNTGGELDITQEQYRTIMHEVIGCN
ncbi:unnamed protein product [Rotaria sordida]|uniref:Dynactin subunit 1 n=1 Tax=Rotaria sordida TaxID=392033 RepID=A0A813WSG7_9BILA|nr:unnamed protein product [Rotaria sordida]CAF3946940.1 unnamed protein product [Rotaria sordida]